MTASLFFALLALLLAACAVCEVGNGGKDEVAPASGSSSSSLGDEGSTTSTQSTDHGRPLLYGTEISWPMQRLPGATTDTPSAHADFQSRYNRFMQGCYEAYGEDKCVESEGDRLRANALQPGRVPRNYTSAGYAKVAAPSTSFTILRQFWEDYSDRYLMEESWDEGNVYTNHWQARTLMLPVHPVPTPPLAAAATTAKTTEEKSRRSQRGRRNVHRQPSLSVAYRRKIVEEVQSILERWTGVPLQPTSLYGLRSYTNGSILAPHVDRAPLVISAIINVAQDVDEDWVLELIGRDGLAVNITMEPGSMVLYESHSIIHGRPYPMQGRFYTNCFLHYEPIGYSAALRNAMGESSNSGLSTRDKFQAALAAQGSATSATSTPEPQSPPLQRGHKVMGRQTLPAYIQEGTLEASRWRQEFVFSRVEIKEWVKPKRVRTENAHVAAAIDDVDRLREIAAEDPKAMDKADLNGWKPIHEAARGGNVRAIVYLLTEHEVDVNERTNKGRGGNALWWAEQGLPEDHMAIEVLRQHGAVAIAPDPKLLND